MMKPVVGENDIFDGSQKSYVVVNSNVFRRRKIVYIAREMLSNLFLNGRKELYVRGLPDDAICIDTFYDHYRERFGMVYTSKEFDEIPFGERFPQMTPTIKLRLM